MSGSVSTQSRRSTVPLRGNLHASNGVDYPVNYSQVDTDRFTGHQTTTSFRSNRASGVALEYQQARDEILSRGHSGNSYSRPYDTGHEFSSTKQELLLSHKNVTWTSWYGHTYTGPLFCVYDSGSPWIDPPKSNLILAGTQAIERTVPTNPVAGMSTFLGELREGFPSLMGAASLGRFDNIPKKLGGEYLNYQFGWVPLVSDLKKFLYAAQNSTRIFEQFQRDSGHHVRRRYFFPDESSVTSPISVSNTLGNTYLDATTWGYPGRLGSSTKTISTKKKTWFSGSYTYYLDQGTDILSKMRYYEQQANHLLGTRITPEVLWELAPWSWLLDWYADIGSIISNASALQQDNLVMRYGYLMQTSITEVVYRHTDIPSLHGGWTPGAVVNTFRTTRKERIRATPYGFGLDTDLFTGSQWAILAALGMTKAPKTLRQF